MKRGTSRCKSNNDKCHDQRRQRRARTNVRNNKRKLNQKVDSDQSVRSVIYDNNTTTPSPEPEVYVPNYSPLEQLLLQQQQQQLRQQLEESTTKSVAKKVNRLNSSGDPVTYMDLSGNMAEENNDICDDEPSDDFIRELDALLLATENDAHSPTKVNTLECIYGNMSSLSVEPQPLNSVTYFQSPPRSPLPPQPPPPPPPPPQFSFEDPWTAAVNNTPSSIVDKIFQLAPRQQQTITEGLLEKTLEFTATNFSPRNHRGESLIFFLFFFKFLYSFYIQKIRSDR